MSVARTPRLLERLDLTELERLCREHAAYERAPWAEGDRRPRLEALLIDADDARCWVIDGERGELAGFASVRQELSTWNAAYYLHLDCLYLRPAWRGRGLGHAFMVEAARAVDELGVIELQWQTPAWSEDAIRFYERLGARAAPKLRFTLDRERCRSLGES